MIVYPAVKGWARLDGDTLTLRVRAGRKMVTTRYTVSRSERTWTLTKESGEFYSVSFARRDEPRCDCIDASTRDREDGRCKHLKGLEAVGLIRRGR